MLFIYIIDILAYWTIHIRTILDWHLDKSRMLTSISHTHTLSCARATSIEMSISSSLVSSVLRPA